MRQGQQELGPPRMGEPRPLPAERLDLEPRSVDDGLVLLGGDRAHRVENRPAWAHSLCRDPQQGALEVG